MYHPCYDKICSKKHSQRKDTKLENNTSNHKNYLLITTAHKKEDYDTRCIDYLKSLKQALEYKHLFVKIFLLECVAAEGLDYLQIDPKVNIIYSGCRNTYINYGLNELLHIEKFLDLAEDIDKNDAIIKLTGRYFIQNDNFLKMLPLNYDIIAKKDNDIWGSDVAGDSKGVHTFYMIFRKKTIKELVKNINFKENPAFLQHYCVEWLVKEYMMKNTRSYFYDNIMGIITNFSLNKAKILT